MIANYIHPEEKINDIKLPCGCIPGAYRCPEAVKLWNEVNRSNDEWMNFPNISFGKANYEKALAAYYSHFNKKENFNAVEFNPHF